VSGEGSRGRSSASGLTYTMRAGLHCDAVLTSVITHQRGPASVGCTATSYGLEGLGIESRWRLDFPHLSRPALGPT
jgi:hypothetical protein